VSEKQPDDSLSEHSPFAGLKFQQSDGHGVPGPPAINVVVVVGATVDAAALDAATVGAAVD